MESYHVLSFASIPVLGVCAQIVASRFNIPSILLLLVSGFLMGPIFGLLNPEHLFGETFYPFVSLAVALILFEGGLTLKISDLKHTGKVVRNLITVGYVITCLGTMFLAHLFFGFDLKICLLLGAILAVSGPTVVTPLLRQIKVKQSLSAVLKWEGITIDPIGATVSVMIYEIILIEQASQAFNVALIIVLKTLVSGILLGSFGAAIVMILFKKKVVADFLEEALTFIVVLFVYALAGVFQSESGLLAVTIMGIVLANQKLVTTKHILTFKENITVLLLSSLFIMLAAKIELHQLLMVINTKTLLFVFSLIFIVRPICVFVSTINSKLMLTEKLFLASLYPRGIVAAAIASIFSIQLDNAGIEHAADILPITFLTIIITVTFYALIGRPIINIFRLHRIQKGILIAGAHPWARELGSFLMGLNFQVLFVDTNIENTLQAKQQKLKCINGNILSDSIIEMAESSGYGKLIAVTKSDEVNLLSTLKYTEIFGKNNVSRIVPKDYKKDIKKGSHDLLLFEKGIGLNLLETNQLIGSTFEAVEITKTFTFEEFQKQYSKSILIGMVTPNNIIKLFYIGHKFTPIEGYKVLVYKKDEKSNKK